MNMVIFGLSGSRVVALINELILLFNNIHEMTKTLFRMSWKRNCCI